MNNKFPVWLTKRNMARCLVVFMCALLIATRAVWPEWRFDNVSMALFLVAVVTLLIPNIGDLISRIKRIKKGDFELDLSDKIPKLIQEASEIQKDSASVAKPIDPQQLESETQAFLIALSDVDARGTILEVALYLERTLLELAEHNNLLEVDKPSPPYQLMKKLLDNHIVNQNVYQIYREFWSIRNQAVHDPDFDISYDRLKELVELGVRIKHLLRIPSPNQS
jgi:uncharacterized protein YutE (UPF0331/DUF86 family)